MAVSRGQIPRIPVSASPRAHDSMIRAGIPSYEPRPGRSEIQVAFHPVRWLTDRCIRQSPISSLSAPHTHATLTVSVAGGALGRRLLKAESDSALVRVVSPAIIPWAERSSSSLSSPSSSSSILTHSRQSPSTGAWPLVSTREWPRARCLRLSGGGKAGRQMSMPDNANQRRRQVMPKRRRYQIVSHGEDNGYVMKRMNWSGAFDDLLQRRRLTGQRPCQGLLGSGSGPRPMMRNKLQPLP